MALSEVDICNLALGWVGGNLITSLDDATNEARLCKAMYESSRDAALEDRDWTFATSRKYLTPLASAPAFGYSKAFQLPSDCLRVIQVDSDADFNNGENWTREEDTILANVSALYIRYIKQITNPAKFSPGFSHACAARLAADLAIPIAGSKELQALMQDLYIYKRDNAGTSDNMQGKNVVLRSRRLTGVR